MSCRRQDAGNATDSLAVVSRSYTTLWDTTNDHRRISEEREPTITQLREAPPAAFALCRALTGPIRRESRSCAAEICSD